MSAAQIGIRCSMVTPFQNHKDLVKIYWFFGLRQFSPMCGLHHFYSLNWRPLPLQQRFRNKVQRRFSCGAFLRSGVGLKHFQGVDWYKGLRRGHDCLQENNDGEDQNEFCPGTISRRCTRSGGSQYF